MGANHPQPQARIGGLYTLGPNPYPGGEVDTGGSLVPPYEGRSTGPDTSVSTKASTASVERQMERTASGGDAEIGKVASPAGEVGQPPTPPLTADDLSH